MQRQRRFLCKGLQHLPLQGAFGQGAPQGECLVGKAGPTLGCIHLAALLREVEHLPRQGHGATHCLLKGWRAVFPDEAVGVVLGGQEKEADAARIAGVGQTSLECPCRSLAAGGVAIEAEHDAVSEAHQLADMVFGARRAQGGHRMSQAPLGQRHHVHVALHHQGIAGFADGGACFVQPIEFPALDEHGCLGGIQVLRFAAVQHPSAETDHLALDRADGEHDAVAEAVVALLLGRAHVLPDHQSGFFELGVVIGWKRTGQAVPTVGGVADGKLLGHFTGQAPPLEVGHGHLAGLELLPVVHRSPGQEVGQGGGFLAPLRLCLTLFLRPVIVRNGHARLLGQFLHRLHEAQAHEFREKANGVPVHTAAKAVIGLARGADDEAGRFLAVEGAQALVIDPRLLQLHVPADHVDHVDTGQEVLDEATGDHPASLAGRGSVAAKMAAAPIGAAWPLGLLTVRRRNRQAICPRRWPP